MAGAACGVELPYLQNHYQPSMQEVSQPSMQEISQPSMQNDYQSSMQEISQPSMQEISQPSMQEVYQPSMQEVYQMLRREASHLAAARAHCSSAAASTPANLLGASQPTNTPDTIQAERLRQLSSGGGSGLWRRALLQASRTSTPPSGWRDITEEDLQTPVPASGNWSGGTSSSQVQVSATPRLKAAHIQPHLSSTQGVKRARVSQPASPACIASAPESAQVKQLRRQVAELESKARAEAAEKAKVVRSLEMRLKHMHKSDSAHTVRIEHLERTNKQQLHEIQELVLEKERLIAQVARLEASAHVRHPSIEHMHDVEMFINVLDE